MLGVDARSHCGFSSMLPLCCSCCVEDSADLPIDELPSLEIESLEGPSLDRVVTLYRSFKPEALGISKDGLYGALRALKLQVSESQVEEMIGENDLGHGGYLDFRSFVRWMCRCRVSARWEELLRQVYALEILIVILAEARVVQVSLDGTAIGKVPHLEVLDESAALSFVRCIETARRSAEPIRQAVLFRELVAKSKRITGDCLGLLDQVASFREKLWQSTLGHRRLLGFQVKDEEALDVATVQEISQRLRFLVLGAMNLANVQQRALNLLHAVNHVYKALRSCRKSFMEALETATKAEKPVTAFLATADACEKLAYFEKDLSTYRNAAYRLSCMLAMTPEDTGSEQLDLKIFKDFKQLWKEMRDSYESTRRLAEGYDDWTVKLWNATKQVLWLTCKRFGMEVPGGHGAKDEEAEPRIPLRKGFREVPRFVPLES